MEKSFEGKDYVCCPFHQDMKWVLKHRHADGCRNDQNFTSPGTSVKPLNRARKHSMKVMEQPGFDDELVEEAF
jgi:hypothetical protein